jgi:hypothetical protein
LGALERYERAIEHLDTARVAQSIGDKRIIAVLAGAVNDEQNMIAAIDGHQIVENAALRVGEIGIAHAPGLETGEIGGKEPLERKRRVPGRARFRAKRDLSHMRNVEERGGRAGVKVLLEHPRLVVDRHVVTGERPHARAERKMQSVERGVPECRNG